LAAVFLGEVDETLSEEQERTISTIRGKLGEGEEVRLTLKRFGLALWLSPCVWRWGGNMSDKFAWRTMDRRGRHVGLSLRKTTNVVEVKVLSKSRRVAFASRVAVQTVLSTESL
jgi:hypothetical protein